MSILGLLVPVLLVIIVAGMVLNNVRIVPQSEAWVVERLGAYKETWKVGLHFKIPFIESVVKKVSLKEQVIEFPPQPVITHDNVTIQIDTVMYFQITDPKLYCYGVSNPLVAVEKLTATTLRAIIGEMELDHTLTSRDVINSNLRASLDQASDSWGIKLMRAEIKDVTPPREIIESMEQQMKAERSKRAKILSAEAVKQSDILVAEGNKASVILNAEAEKESAILRAEAEKQARIKDGEGEAEYILRVQEATAKGIELVNNSKPSREVLAMRSLETLEKVANGQATKIIIPSELQNLAGLVTTLKEVGSPAQFEKDSYWKNMDGLPDYKTQQTASDASVSEEVAKEDS